jgi:hypothetical protein
VVDLDEFMYGTTYTLNGTWTNNTQTIASVLSAMPEDEMLVCVPWNMFGTSGHVKQPPCIVPYFLKRTKHKYSEVGKCAVRVLNATKLGVHYHETNTYPGRTWRPKSKVFDSKFHMLKGTLGFPLAKFHLKENNMKEWPLMLNHYQVQSEEHYTRKRMAADSFRVLSPVGYWDQDSVVDDMLYNKSHWRRENVPMCGPYGW